MTTLTANRHHPSPWPKYLLARIEPYLSAESRRLGRPLLTIDPMCGIGRVHDLPARIAHTIGVEIEWEWAACRRRSLCADATALPFRSRSFDCFVLSPAFGNRLADHHEAKDSCAGCQGTGVVANAEGCADAPWVCKRCGIACTCGEIARLMKAHNLTCSDCRTRICKSCGGIGLSKRYTYRMALGRMPTEGSAATMNWSCVAPGSLVLRGDWRWVPVESLEMGDSLVGFDAEMTGGTDGTRRARRWRESKVEAIALGVKPAVRVSFTDGFSVVCTTDHPWLTRLRTPSLSEKGAYRWREAGRLQLGDRVELLMPVWEEDRSYEAGWLAGMFDGEGWLTTYKRPLARSQTIGLSQKLGPVWDRVIELLQLRGLDFSIAHDPKASRVRLRGDLSERLRFLGTIRPERLLAKVRLDGFGIKGIGHRLVASVESLGDQQIVHLQTSTSTYLVNGMGAHNSQGGKYRAIHSSAYTELHRVLRPHALGVLNVKNHLRAGDQRVPCERLVVVRRYP